MFGDFFKDKKILVTGIAGVKGSWLALELLEAGSQVVGVDIKTPEVESNFLASGLRQRTRFIHGDVADLHMMRELMRGVDGVFHLAAVALVGEAQQKPLEAYRSNTYGTAVVLEAMRLSPAVKYGVMVTTDKVYRSKGGEMWEETDPLFATHPYPVSKACAEEIIADYERVYLRPNGKCVGIGRAGNVVIGGDFYSSHKTGGFGRVFVDCYEALAAGRPPQIFSPKFTRPYTYGLDIVTGYMTLMSQLDRVPGTAFNFGPHEQPGVENSVLATRICELWGTGVMWQTGTPRSEPFEKQSLSWEKARRLLGWQPAYTLEEALVDTTRWYKTWAQQGKTGGEGSMYAFNQSLIKGHCEAAQKRQIAWATPL